MMAERFPKRWYEWVLVCLTGFILLVQSIYIISGLFNSPGVQSQVLPLYVRYIVILNRASLLLSSLLGLCGILLMASVRKKGWAPLLTATLFFLWFYGCFVTEELSTGISDMTPLLYSLDMLILLMLLLRNHTRALYDVTWKQGLFAAISAALLIFLYADAYGISLFLAAHL